MNLRWLGHATVLVELDGTTVLTDPVLGNHIARFIRRRVAPIDREALPPVDAVLISHLHHDHLDLPSLRALGSETRIIVPDGAGAWLTRRGFGNVEEIARGQRLSLGRIDIEATHAEHAAKRSPVGPSAPALGFLVEGTRRLYFAGDTGLFDGMASLRKRIDGPLDVALLPVSGWGPTLRGGHLDPVAAAEAARRLAPHRAVPIHWGTYWPAGLMRVRPNRRLLPAREFAREVGHRSPATDVAVVAPGDLVPNVG